MYGQRIRYDERNFPLVLSIFRVRIPKNMTSRSTSVLRHLPLGNPPCAQ